MKLKATIAFCIIVIFIALMNFNFTDSIKINGVSLVAPRDSISSNSIESVKKINASWVAIIPYGFIDKTNPEVRFDSKYQWWGERSSGAITTIRYAKDQGLKVMLKPHTWVRGEGWAGDFSLNNEQDWEKWEKSYEKFILRYAKIADSMHVEMLCIGTEYRKAATQRPEFWSQLIDKTRNIYSGKLIYAANWDNYDNISFWNKLDYIGIDAYYPLSDEKTPSSESLSQAWKKVIPELKQLSDRYKKKIIFTEFGYQSVDYSAKGHWLRDDNLSDVNQEAQANSYQAIFGLWEYDWFGGGFLWKWHTNHEVIGGPNCKRYTPQNKKTETVISEFYCNY